MYSNSTRDSDSHLLHRIAQQDRPALAELYDRHGGRVYGLARKLLQDESRAEEVVQDVFLNTWRKAASFSEARGGALTWLLAICRNRCIDILRSRRNQEPLQFQEEIIVADADRDPATLYGQTELRQRVTRALNELTPADRQLVELSFFQGFSHTEIAEQERIPLGTVKSRLRGSLALLRRMMVKDETAHDVANGGVG